MILIKSYIKYNTQYHKNAIGKSLKGEKTHNPIQFVEDGNGAGGITSTNIASIFSASLGIAYSLILIESYIYNR